MTGAELAAAEHAELSPEATRTRTITWQDPDAVAGAGAEMVGIDYMRAITTAAVPPPPIAVLMRFHPIEVEPGFVVSAGEPGDEHYNPIGAVHGGYASILLDSVLGCAVHTTLEAGVGYTTLSLEVKFLRPITREVGPVRAEATVDHRGRRQATAHAKLTDSSGERLLATATTTCMILG